MPARIVFVDLNGWQHRPKPLPPQIRGFRVPVNSPEQECTFTKPDCAAFYSRSHRAVIRAYDEAGNVIETHEQTLRRGYSITMNARNRTAKLRRGARLP